MITCPHPYDLQSYADGALSGAERSRVEAHLASCGDCAARVRELGRLRALMATSRVEPPVGLLERLLDLLRTVVPVRRLGCAEAVELASAYLDDELNQTERETLEAHLFACEGCYREYVAMREAAQALRATPRVAPSVDLKARILAAVEAEKAGPVAAPVSRGHAGFGWRRALVPSLALAAVALLGYVALNLEGLRPGPTGATVAQAPSVAAMGQPAAEAPVAETVEPTPSVTAPALKAPVDEAAPAPVTEPSGTTREPIAERPRNMVAAGMGDSWRALGALVGRPAAPRSAQTAPAAQPRRGTTRVASHPLPAEAIVSPTPGTQTPAAVSTPMTGTRPGSRLTTGARTPAAVTPRLAITPGDGWGVAPVSVPERHDGAGVTTTRRLAAAPPVTIHPAVVIRHASTTTRQPVAEAPAAPRCEVASNGDDGGTRVAQRNWVPRVAEDRTTLFVGREPGAEDLKARSDRVNARARSERLFPDDEAARLN